MEIKKLLRLPLKVAFSLAGLLLVLLFAQPLYAVPRLQQTEEKDLAGEIRVLLEGHKLWLNYPVSTKRFYEQKSYTPQWLTVSRQDKAWASMLLLDCVLQFGLSYNDYRYNEHLPSTLHDIFEKPNHVSLTQQARFEIMLTDDMITFVNQLHFGVLNPSFTPGFIDSTDNEFRAETVMANVMDQGKLMKVLAGVQPKSKEYERLQEYLSSSIRYSDNCYEIPEGELQNVAMNMERLRWAAIEEDNYILVNIPAFSLKYYYADTVNEFKVIVGRPSTPTPQLQSQIEYITTGPDRKVAASVFIKQVLPNALKDHHYLENNQITIYDKKGAFVKADRRVLTSIIKDPSGYYARQAAGCDNASGAILFSFPNIYEVSMHDAPDKTVFEQADRALSKGGISIANADSLAALLLKNSGTASRLKEMQEAIISYKKKTFTLNKVMPVKVVYLTSDVLNGKLVSYTDIYDLDRSLQSIMFPAARPLSMR
ncbi:MAG: L,D-transpeptidase family protein [Mucilaginibacter sp.]|jgi:murein L,D-transpeptidase YcbB/YkuD|uniref:L,D-transpeptidase family protein n=1 Tax=Mucilaginibacter sp. TaxID=1882438 RepID=UPI003562103A